MQIRKCKYAPEPSTVGETIKVTSHIASRWVKAAFLALIGIVILLYAEKLVRDLRTALSEDVNFTWTWDLLRILLWVLVAWLLVDSVLIVVLSLTEHRYSAADLMQKLEQIEKKVDTQSGFAKKPSTRIETVLTPSQEEEVPPPPS